MTDTPQTAVRHAAPEKELGAEHGHGIADVDRVRDEHQDRKQHQIL